MKQEHIIRAVITRWDKTKVWYFCPELCQTRISDIKPLFEGMKLFKGKKILIETSVVPGTMTCKCYERKESKLRQLWNYYVCRNFKIE